MRIFVTGASGWIGSAVVAELLAADHAGTVLHAVGEEGVAIRDVAQAIGRGLDLPVSSITAEQAARFGFLAGLLSLDIPASSAITQELLSWQPSGPGLIADLDRGHYFEDAAA